MNMDPISNPYSPGAGTPPHELVGRDELRERVRVAIERVKRGKAAKSVLMVGLRGVGKTVLLEQMRLDAEHCGAYTVRMESPENRSLPAILAPQLRVTLIKLSRIDAAKAMAERSLKALAGFVSALKVAYQDIEVGLDFKPEPGLADNGDLEADLATLLEQVGRAAQEADTAIVLFIDELQYVNETELAALITALHRCAQLKLPITMVGAGLPQLRARCGNAKSYAERLFDYPEIGALPRDDAYRAIHAPAEDEGVRYADGAIEAILEETSCYPYFLQEWGKHAWDVAVASPITTDDVARASEVAIAALDEGFFRVRFDRLTPKEKEYLRAMSELGPGPHRSGEIAAQLEKSVNSFGPVRDSLINKGMIWSPKHGDTAFTVPLFDEFMRRIAPD